MTRPYPAGPPGIVGHYLRWAGAAVSYPSQQRTWHAGSYTLRPWVLGGSDTQGVTAQGAGGCWGRQAYRVQIYAANT